MIVAKKKRFEVDVPLIEEKIPVLAIDQDAIVGRIIKLDLTRLLKGKNLEANIIIKKYNENLVGDIISIKLLPSYIARMIRKGISYVEDSFVVEGKESQIIIKPYLLTRKKVHRSVRKALRNRAREIITEFVKTKNNKEIFFAILTGNLQKELIIKLKKIYPLTLAEIRIAKLK
ncbi:MAG: hypothetical protein QW041_01480 [Candidatus Pacearchaeota archaeon]